METHTSRFCFRGYTIDDRTNTVSFRYTIELADKTIDVVEKLTIPGFSSDKERVPEALLKRIFDQLTILLGISYWKLYCPRILDTGPVVLTREQAEFWNTVYTKGLGEFFYKNQLDYRGLIRFPHVEAAASPPITMETTDNSLVQLGGGKDSIVTAELLLRAQKDFSLITVDAHPLHRAIAQKIGKPLVEMQRTVDPQLFELNKHPDAYKGHIPISAIYAFVDLLFATLTGCRYIIASNEESANYGNVTYLGQEINHQWSKTVEFEMLFQRYVSTYITPSITYFSLLRPIKEIKIVQLFSRHEKYFSFFTSCNTNFRRTVTSPFPQWCGLCPKCAFVFVLLSAFIPNAQLRSIFRKNLYEDLALLPLFRQLVGLSGIKPFECVGTPEETRLGIYLASENEEYAHDPVVIALKKELGAVWDTIGETKEKQLEISGKHNIPKEFQHILTHET